VGDDAPSLAPPSKGVCKRRTQVCEVIFRRLGADAQNVRNWRKVHKTVRRISWSPRGARAEPPVGLSFAAVLPLLLRFCSATPRAASRLTRTIARSRLHPCSTSDALRLQPLPFLSYTLLSSLLRLYPRHTLLPLILRLYLRLHLRLPDHVPRAFFAARRRQLILLEYILLHGSLALLATGVSGKTIQWVSRIVSVENVG
jgi:hypothetical protein